VVLEGALRDLPRLSVVFVAPDEAAFAAEAGPDGADLVVVQYPRGRAHVTG
jgi:hypothetical protein